MCRQLPKKALDIAKSHGDNMAKANNKLLSTYERLVCRANLILNQKLTINLKPDCIENLFILAEQKYLIGEANDSINTLGQYKKLKLNYDLKNQGEDIWAALNNNLGVSYLSIVKPFLATKYLQNAVKEHFRAMESDDSKRLITCRDRPFYVHNLGVALLAANKPDGAFECLVEAIRHYPSNPRIWLRLAECCVKKYCNDEAQQFTVKKIGKNPHSRLLLERKRIDKYSNSGESFAIPSLSLEFATLCLRNATSLISNQEIPSDTNAHIIQAPPGIPLNWKQWCQLKNSVLVLQTYIFLQLQDPFAALITAKDVLSQPEVSNEHKALAHIYAAEALISLDKLNEAVEHLHPPMINEIASALPPQMRDKICVSVWAKAVECQIIRVTFQLGQIKPLFLCLRRLAKLPELIVVTSLVISSSNSRHRQELKVVNGLVTCHREEFLGKRVTRGPARSTTATVMIVRNPLSTTVKVVSGDRSIARSYSDRVLSAYVLLSAPFVGAHIVVAAPSVMLTALRTGLPKQDFAHVLRCWCRPSYRVSGEGRSGRRPRWPKIAKLRDFLKSQAVPSEIKKIAGGMVQRSQQSTARADVEVHRPADRSHVDRGVFASNICLTAKSRPLRWINHQPQAHNTASHVQLLSW
ncbi:CCR4-NOT transcription complex subunit 10 [Eumeta japonica]|uniref:CCR4-NOT transcription complex subunit 10 n=1 Tax=Eumeta variegata TaxID=151549 RepID=A0A4C1UD53_EUMVA|nr:CCR4-NOT transcription complex subunit 10 [Eumeta japonica]